MKLSFTLLLVATFGATFVLANNIPQVQHVIIVVQENRTPTNLFQLDQTLITNGAHIVSQGTCGHGLFTLHSDPLFTCYDPAHNHSVAGSASWTDMWDHGNMDGACKIMVGGIGGTCRPSWNCPDNRWTYCPQMAYAQNTQWSSTPPYHILDPYFQIANQYGFANYMFQTNQGPSFPAHQFLISGTSAPAPYLDPNGTCTGPFPNEKCWQWFDAENLHGSNSTAGCIAPSGTTSLLIDPNSVESLYYTPPPPVNQVEGFPCYSHPSLPTLLDNAGISWRYYLREPHGGLAIWTGPAAIYDLCVDPNRTWNGTCNKDEYLNNVQHYLPGGPNYSNDYAPILTDIANCKLPPVSWVIPDGNWSDHAAVDGLPGDGGPSWVAAIVNAIGVTPSACEGGNGYWSDTVILVVWDDWGGYYDDVVPPDCTVLGQPCSGYSNGSGGQYVYGFRVPLLVVGAYAKPGYISGANGGANPDCKNNTYCHDFGSILNFIEYAFGTGGNPLGGQGGISPNYNYADWLVMDKGQAPNKYSLYDFFDFTTFHQFQTINGAKYPPDCFHRPMDTGCFTTYPLDPDNDANEAD